MKGGETVVGPGPLIDGRMGVRDSMLQLAEKLPPEQRKKQLGSDRFKLMGWPGYEIMAPLFEKTYGVPFPMSAHNSYAPSRSYGRQYDRRALSHKGHGHLDEQCLPQRGGYQGSLRGPEKPATSISTSSWSMS